MTIRKFLLVSFIFHLLLFSGLYFVPEKKLKEAKELITTLVTPDEIRKPELSKPLPKVLPIPGPKTIRPVRPHQKLKDYRSAPAPFARSLPSPEKPVVPGEGTPGHKSPTEDIYRKPGTGKEAMDEGITGKSIFRPSDKPGYLPNRKRIFDPGVIDQLARKDSEGKKGSHDNPITFDTSEYKLQGYMTQLRQKIESIWVYPPEAAAHGIYGDLKIQFTIKKDGRLGSVELVRTSGHKMLDDAAIKALRDGEPYWPLPDSWGKDSYTILGHFVYVYGVNYIK